MNREQRFVNLVQMVLTVRMSRGHWFKAHLPATVSEADLVACLDDAYFFANKNSETIQTMELDKLAISYVNNWLNNSPGFRGNSLGG